MESPPPPPDEGTTAPPPPPSPAPTPAPDGRPPLAKGALALSIIALGVCWLTLISLLFVPVILVAVVAVIIAIRAKGARRRMATAAAVLAVLALVAGIGIAGAVALSDDGGGVKYSDLMPGDCLKKPGATFETTERIDCAKPHDLEVFALVDDPAPKGARYPGRDLMDREANVACPPQFESYVGLPFDQSQLAVTFFVPVKATWDADSRRLLCTVSAKSGKLTGSVKGSKR
ncbi:MAG: septum formation family protein [Actinobacteria bacterium]|nr:septum formation family protein [Actinomycetota bacterium]